MREKRGEKTHLLHDRNLSHGKISMYDTTHPRYIAAPCNTNYRRNDFPHITFYRAMHDTYDMYCIVVSTYSVRSTLITCISMTCISPSINLHLIWWGARGWGMYNMYLRRASSITLAVNKNLYKPIPLLSAKTRPQPCRHWTRKMGSIDPSTHWPYPMLMAST